MSNGEPNAVDAVREIDTSLASEAEPETQGGIAGAVEDIGGFVIQNSPAAALGRLNKSVLGLGHVNLADPSTYSFDPSTESMTDPGQAAQARSQHPGAGFLEGVPQAGRNPAIYATQQGAKGVGKAALSGKIERTVGPAVPGELVAAQMAFAKQQADFESMSQNARAEAAGLAVNLMDDFGDALEEHHAVIMEQTDALITQAETEAQGIGDLIDAAKSNQINPGQFFANIGDAGRFAAAIAVGAGAMASVFAGGPNTAFQIIQKAIDRNVRSQLANQQHNRALIAHQTNFVNTIRGLSKDRMQYGNYLRLGLTAMTQAEIGKLNFAFDEAQAQIASKAVYSKLGAWLVDQRIRAITNMQARVTANWKGLAQYYRALNLSPTGAPPARGKGRAPSQGGPGPTADAISLAQESISAGGSGKQIVDSYISRLHQRKGPVQAEDREVLEAMLKQMADAGDPAAVAAYNQAVAAPDEDYVKGRTVPIAYGDRGVAHLKVIDEKRWERAGQPAAVAKALAQIEDFIELDQLMGTSSIPPDAALLKDIGIVDGRVALTTFFSGEQAEQRAKMRALTTAITQRYFSGLQEGARNAMNVRWEREFAQRGAGTDVTILEWLGDTLRNEPNVRRRRALPAAREAIQQARSTITSAGLWFRGL